ncbi:MAG: DUF3035 domain-containing protein [Alphaproteobacteria bacterium]|nr:DUF3035 domain-containing protein [Alphaproteobacteria bacterium]
MKKTTILFVALCAGSFALTGCSGAKKQLGLEKQVPDEFAVVKRAPLSLPPNYALRPPQPGAPRPQEQSTNEVARQTVFGAEEPQAATTAAAQTNSETLLLQQAGARGADPAIRTKIDQEADIQAEDNRPVAEKLLGLGNDQEPARVVNAKEEAARIRNNMETGQPVTEGETPYVDQQ